MDISVNKVIKSQLRWKFSEWYSAELTELFTNGEDDEPVDVSAARMKCIGGQWFEEVIEYLQDNPLTIVNRFKHAGIHEALGVFSDDIELSENEVDCEDSDLQEESSDEDEESSDDNGSLYQEKSDDKMNYYKTALVYL